MPQKPKPFTNFLNQGMQNTNNQANNINMPSNPINTPMNNNAFNAPQFSDSAIRPPVEQPKPSSFLDNLTMNNKVTRNFMNPGQPGGGGQLFGEGGGIFDYGDIIGIEGEQPVDSPYEEIDPAIGGGGSGGGTPPDPTWQDYWDNWASTISESSFQYADYNMTEGSADYNYLMNQWQQFYNEAGGDSSLANLNFHNWLMSGEYQPYSGPDLSETVFDDASNIVPDLDIFPSPPKPPTGLQAAPRLKPPYTGEGGIIHDPNKIYIAGAGETGMEGINPFEPPGSKPWGRLPDITDKPINIADYINRPPDITDKPINIADYFADIIDKPISSLYDRPENIFNIGEGDGFEHDDDSIGLEEDPQAIGVGDLDDLDKAYLGAGTGETGMEGIDPFAPITAPRPPEKTDKPINIADYFSPPLYEDPDYEDYWMDYYGASEFENISNVDWQEAPWTEYDLNQDGQFNQLDWPLMEEQGYSWNEFMQLFSNYLDAQAPWVPVMTGQLHDYAGGGGLAGALAKRLSYPSTMGGFAGVGSGAMSPSISSLEDLLAQLQG